MNEISSKKMSGIGELPSAITGFRESDSVQPTTDGETDFRWEPVIYFYCLYIGIMWIGDIFDATWTSSLGAALFLVCLYAKYWRFLFNLKPNLMLFGVILCIALPLIPLASFDEKMLSMAYQELIKYYALNFVILIGMSLPLTPLTRARRAWLLYLLILVFLLSGWLLAPVRTSVPDLYTTETRVKGLLANGNTFALTAMILLLLVNEDRSGKLIKGATQAVVLFLIYISHTSGALLAYLVGILYRFIYGDGRLPMIARWAAVVTGMVLAVTIFVSIPPNTFKRLDSTTEKIQVTWDNVNRVLSGRAIDYYGIIERKGQDVTSGVWRLYHWSHVLHKFGDSSLDKILFGHGVGAMESLFGLKAHNDYLRFLFQTGLIGLLLNLLIWGTLYRRMEVRYRWVVVMIAFYCISENNYDHFPTMSMLVLYMMGARRREQDKLPPMVTAHGDERLINNNTAPVFMEREPESEIVDLKHGA